MEINRVGSTVSHYQLLETLGRGGMGVVYKARDLTLERFVALKFLPVGREHGIFRQRLLLEARAASALDHPNICTIFEIEETPDGDLFLAMAFCEGETLKAKIERGQLELSEALALTHQVAAGLSHAHLRRVVHRDVKPSNLILTRSGQVKIVDFGVAMRADQPRLTQEGAAVGTVAYMSPEQLLGKPVDERTDLWSLGVVLYELLTGCLPFASPTDQAYAAAVLSMPPKPVSRRWADLPVGIDDLFDRMLAKDPLARHQKAEEVIQHLAALQDGEPPAGSPGRSSTSATLPLVLLRPAPPRSPDLRIHPRVSEVFVGRQPELAALQKHLVPEPAETFPAVVCAIQGMPGAGKSFLADRFALDHASQFPGGYLRLVLDPKAPAVPETLIEELADRLKVSGGAS